MKITMMLTAAALAATGLGAGAAGAQDHQQGGHYQDQNGRGHQDGSHHNGYGNGYGNGQQDHRHGQDNGGYGHQDRGGYNGGQRNWHGQHQQNCRTVWYNHRQVTRCGH